MDRPPSIMGSLANLFGTNPNGYPSIYDGLPWLAGAPGMLRYRDAINRLSNGAAMTNDMNAAQSASDAVPRAGLQMEPTSREQILKALLGQ